MRLKVPYRNHARRHLRGGSDPLLQAGDLHPYVDYGNDVQIPTGTDPVCAGSIWLSVATDLINPSLSGERAVILGQALLTIATDPGVAGTSGSDSVYNFQVVHEPSNFGSQGAIGAGYTAPGGVPYAAILVSSGFSFGYGNILVPNVTDPDAADLFNWARPEWPGIYDDGDILFSGIWNIPVQVD